MRISRTTIGIGIGRGDSVRTGRQVPGKEMEAEASPMAETLAVTVPINVLPCWRVNVTVPPLIGRLPGLVP